MRTRIGCWAALFLAAGCAANGSGESSTGTDGGAGGGGIAGNTAVGPQGFTVKSAFFAHADGNNLELAQVGIYLVDVAMTCDDFQKRTVLPGRDVHLWAGSLTMMNDVAPGTYDVVPPGQLPASGIHAEITVDAFPAGGGHQEDDGAGGTLTISALSDAEISGSFDGQLAAANGSDASRLSGTFHATYCPGIDK